MSRAAAVTGEPGARTRPCPRCGAVLSRPATADGAAPSADRCGACDLEWVWRGGVLDVLADTRREEAAARVESFYERSPFPGYAPSETASSLIERSRRSPFLVAFDRAVPVDGTVLSVGCGTAHVPAFLAVSSRRRRVVGVDGCAASLEVADTFARRAGAGNLELVRADLFDLPFPARSFDVVSCRGVVHHTPRPWEATDRVAEMVAPGGVLLIGIYESFGRAWHRFRMRLARLRGGPEYGGRPIRALDPVLRHAGTDEERKRIWEEDQYRHPVEHLMPFPQLLARLEARGFEWVRSLPPVPAGGTSSLFDTTPRPGAAAMSRLRTGWLLKGPFDPDAGLVFLVVRRRGTT